MLKPLQYRLICTIGVASIALLALDNGLYYSNQSLQAQTSARAQYIQQTNAIGTLYQQTARTLANLASEHGDEDVKTLLIEQGFTLNQGPATLNQGPANPASKR